MSSPTPVPPVISATASPEQSQAATRIAEPAAYDAVVGSYLAAISIVIVYHMFALQTWLESVTRAVDEAALVERDSAPEDLSRADASSRLSRVEADFPVVQLLIVGSAIFVLDTMAIVAATHGSLAFWFWGMPIFVLLLVFVASTLATRVRGRRMLDEARKLLGE